jgi:hypothetical protein
MGSFGEQATTSGLRQKSQAENIEVEPECPRLLQTETRIGYRMLAPQRLANVAALAGRCFDQGIFFSLPSCQPSFDGRKGRF